MSASRQSTEQQRAFCRQATILRKNLMEWDHMLHNPRGESWPTMIGRLNAALNQASTLDRSIEDVLEHFVYQPLQAPVNAQDVPFFLSTKMAEVDDSKQQQQDSNTKEDDDEAAALEILTKYENHAAKLAQEYEENMVRF